MGLGPDRPGADCEADKLAEWDGSARKWESQHEGSRVLSFFRPPIVWGPSVEWLSPGVAVGACEADKLASSKSRAFDGFMWTSRRPRRRGPAHCRPAKWINKLSPCLTYSSVGPRPRTAACRQASSSAKRPAWNLVRSRRLFRADSY